MKQVTTIWTCNALLILGLGVLAHGQSPSQQTPAPSSPQNSSQPQPAASASTTPQQPAATLRTSSRMVTVEVVVRDHHGEPVLGLTKDDFQVYEQIASKREQHPQKIAVFRALTAVEIAA